MFPEIGSIKIFDALYNFPARKLNIALSVNNTEIRKDRTPVFSDVGY